MPGSNKLEFKIIKDEKKQDIDITAMSLKAAEAFKTLLTCTLNIIHLSSKTPNVTISIRKGSAMVVAEGGQQQIGQIRKGFDAILTRKSSNKKLVKEWRNLQDLVQQNGLAYEFSFYQNNQKEIITNALKENKRFRTIKVVTKAHSNIKFITGRLIEVGGKSPNIHIDDADGNKLKISCTERSARKANNFLYDSIYISAWTKERNDDIEYELCDSYFQKDLPYFYRFQDFITRYRGLPIVAGLKELHFECRKYLDDKDYSYLRKFLRLFIHESTDINILKTILILLRPFEQHEKLTGPIKDLHKQFNKQLNSIQRNKK
jgi:hypothetical protein